MKIPRSTLRAAAFVLGVASGSLPLYAQGVTTGAISGTVTIGTGQPLADAQVLVTSATNGSRAIASTHADGRYYVQSLEVGGPYTVNVRHIGYTAKDSGGIYVALGQNVHVDFNLSQTTTQLAGVQVVSTLENAVISPSHMGAATTVTDSMIARLPTLGRNFTDFVALTPQISTRGPGNSGAGQNNRFNAIQIDGSVGNDLFGLSSTLQPGGLSGAKQVSLEAVKEYQVLLSPYDVRQGYFSGFLLNAVTKAGSNDFHGSGTYAYRSEQTERNVAYLRAAPFNVKQEGFWMGGPIMKDKIFFSIAPEFQQQAAPQSGPYIGQPAGTLPIPAVQQAGIDSITNVLKTQYGFANPGNDSAVTQKNPLTNMFARLDFVNLPFNSRLVARYNYSGGNQSQGLTRSATAASLSNNGYNIENKTNSELAQLFSTFSNGTSNELLVGYTTIGDVRVTPITAPFVRISRVSNGAGTNGSLTAGTENSSQGNLLDQTVTELSDGFTIPWKDHRVTIGTKNEFYKVRNLFSQNSYGNFTFGTVDSLIANKPSAATLGVNIDQLNGNTTDGAARFNARTYGVYVSDDWQAMQNLSVTMGVRLDNPGLATNPGHNALIQTALGLNTSDVPNSAMQVQPRIGFNWDVTKDQVNQLRGGTGYFMAQPAYVWLSDLFGNSGVNGFGNLTCNGNAAPQMPSAGQPIATNCVGSTGKPAVTVNTVDPNLKFPEVWRSTLGYDRKLPWGVVGTLEGMYTRSVYNFFYQNLGIVANPIGTDSHGRQLYGDILTAGGNISTERRCTDGVSNSGVNAVSACPGGAAGTLGDVIHIENTNTKDYSYSFTGTLQKRFSDSFEGSASYIYGHSYDLYDLTSSVAFSNWSFGRSYSGRQDAEDLAYSKWDSPHRFVVSGTYSLPSKTDVSMTFFADAGTPFEYDYAQDMNADASTANDPIYVPKNAHDTTEVKFQANGTLSIANQQDSLENFIASHDCLNSQRGTIMKRNSCRTPWTKIMNMSVRQSLKTMGMQNVILQVDVFNFLNLLNKNWGAQDLGSTNSPQILTRRTWVQPTPGQPLKLVNGAQPVFTYANPVQFSTKNASSNYALQLQLKYTF